MDQYVECCRTCLAVDNLHPIFGAAGAAHHDKYSQVVLEATGVKIGFNDSLPQLMCALCINVTNETYKFRKKCQETQSSIAELLTNNSYQVKVEGVTLQSDKIYSIDISDLLDDEYDNMTLHEYNQQLDDRDCINSEEIKDDNKCIKLKQKRPVKGMSRTRPTKTDKIKQKEEIVCEYCQKVLTSKLSLRNHYKIHTGFDVVCEHCGKKFITRRLLLMHCKAKHGYEKTDKCSFCEYRASNAEQVKIHERLHTGEKPYVCGECGTGFHRKSSYLQHVAIHLPEKTVQCSLCPARFKSVTLMRIHASRHRPARYTYKCVLCAHTFARRRNVVRHLTRIHAAQAHPHHIERTKCDQLPGTRTKCA